MESGTSESGAVEMFRRQCRVETPVWNLLTLNPAVSHRVCSLRARSLPVSPTGRRTRRNAPSASVPAGANGQEAQESVREERALAGAAEGISCEKKHARRLNSPR